jgi:hypothetical protein
MFRKNEYRQKSLLFGPEMILSERLLAHLQRSWAATFRTEVFERIDEALFAPLYSEQASRPNAPVNVLMGFEIIKAGQGWSDEELYEALSFDMRLRYALGIEDMTSELPFTLRTLYNFRARVQQYTREEGGNLYQEVFEQVTDEHLEKYRVSAHLQRMDSTQVLSNVAQTNRLTLLIGVLQAGVKALPEGEQAAWQEKVGFYLRKRAHEIVFGIRKEEMPAHFQKLGQLLRELQATLPPDEGDYEMVKRVLKEQYKVEDDGEWMLREAEEISADSLQSPYDVEATFRKKNGKVYAGGYVVNVSETSAPENELQLITDIQVAPNVTDDSELLQRSLRNQMERGHEIEEVITDGGYTGPETSACCASHHITHRPTNVRGGKSAPGKLGWEAYEWRLETMMVVCPQGQQGAMLPGRKPDRWIIHFPDEAQCQTCPLLEQCRVQLQKRNGPTLRATTRNIQVALIRQGLRSEDRSLRTVVEGTVRSLKWHLRKDKLPVRGQTAALMYFIGATFMVNLRRIHAYVLRIASQNDADSDILAIFLWFLTTLKLLERHQWRSEAFSSSDHFSNFIFCSNAFLPTRLEKGAA